MIATMETHVSDGVACLTLNNPPLNILTRGVLGDLRTTLTALAADPTVRVLTMTGAGKHFSAGADVSEHLPGEFEAMIPDFVATVTALLEFPVPVIAGVHGKCLGGGCELVQAADVVVAAEGAQFGQPEIALGVVPPVACVLLPQRCTSAAAAEIVLTGQPIDAHEAHQVGLVRHVVPADQLHDAVCNLAAQISRHSAAALRLAKRGLTLGRPHAMQAALQQASALYVNELMQTADAVEGLQAFVEKRPPVWRHQ